MSLYPALRNPSVRAPKWWLVDGHGHTVGRLATQMTNLLTGKYKPSYNPSVDCGDYVILVNAEQVKFTSRKMQQKIYRWHTGWVGGLKQRLARDMHEKKPTEIMRLAVKRMLAKNKLQRLHMIRFLIYAQGDHPHHDQPVEHFFPDRTTPIPCFPRYDPKYDTKYCLSLTEVEPKQWEVEARITVPKLTKKQLKEAKKKGIFGKSATRGTKDSSLKDAKMIGPPLTMLEWGHIRQLLKQGYDGRDWPISPGSSLDDLEYAKEALSQLEQKRLNPLPKPYPVSAYLTQEEAEEVINGTEPSTKNKL